MTEARLKSSRYFSHILHAFHLHQVKLMETALGTFWVTFEFAILPVARNRILILMTKVEILTLFGPPPVHFHRWVSFGITGFPLLNGIRNCTIVKFRQEKNSHLQQLQQETNPRRTRPFLHIKWHSKFAHTSSTTESATK